jgi:uncharacterized protein (DUF2384 family)
MHAEGSATLQADLQTEELAKAVLYAVEVLGTAENANKWLHSDLIVLQNKTPLDLLKSGNFGEYYTLLKKIEYGIFA